MHDIQLYLASSSIRRKELLDSVKLRYKVVVPDIDESQLSDELPLDYVKRMAVKKAQVVKQQITKQKWRELPVLAADTAVVLGDVIYGKPESEEHAYKMWESLSANKHEVYSAIAIAEAGNEEILVETNCTEVHFKELTKQEMRNYWATGEPKDKAGGYAIQGFGSAWVKQIHGSYSGVVGLPLYELRNLLFKVGIDWL